VRIDHIIIGVRDLEDAALRFETSYGLRSLPGGRHPGGTANRIVPLAPPEYIELLAVAEAGSEADLWLSPLLTEGDRIVGWALQVADIESVGLRLGRAPSPGSITHDDGTTGHWRFVGGMSPNRPFFIAYDGDMAHRSARQRANYERANHPSRPGGVEWIEVGGDESRLRRWIGMDQLPGMRFVGGEPGVRSIGVSAPTGELVIDEQLA
jgi:hypothetical protein